MEITDFIQSNAVADYLKEIDYKFTPFEAAYVVNNNYMNPKRTMKERHHANEEIIASLSGGKTDKEKELVKLLKDFMALENKLVDEIYANDNASYYFELLDCITSGWIGWDEKYKNISDCFNGLDAKIKEINNEGGDIKGIVINKEYHDGKEISKLSMTADKEIIYPYWFGLTFEERELYHTFESAVWYCPLFGEMKIPSPFKKGDILFQNSGDDIPSDYESLLTVLKEPTRDKKGKGLWLSPEGNVYSYEIDRVDFEYDYYRGDFSGYKRFARAVSEYAKEKIGLAELFMIRDVIEAEEKAKSKKESLTSKELKLLKSTRGKG